MARYDRREDRRPDRVLRLLRRLNDRLASTLLDRVLDRMERRLTNDRQGRLDCVRDIVGRDRRLGLDRPERRDLLGIVLF